MKILYVILGICIVSIGLFVSFFIGDAQKTVPKVKVSYFTDWQNISAAIMQRLSQEVSNENAFWIGIEPEKIDHVQFAIALKEKLEKEGHPFDLILVDQALQLTASDINRLGVDSVTLIDVKEDWFKVAEKIQLLQQSADKRYLVITASIFTTSFIKENPYKKISDVLKTKGLTFSTAYFSTDTADEKNNLFACDTEDKTGTRDWGCATLNKARTQRRKLKPPQLIPGEPPAQILGLMDLTGEKDYMILFKSIK